MRWEPRNRTQCLRAFAALASSVPSARVRQPVTPALGNLIPLSGFLGHLHTFTQTDYTLTLKKENQFFGCSSRSSFKTHLVDQAGLGLQRSTCLCLLSAVIKGMCRHIHYSTVDLGRYYQLMILPLPGTATYPRTRKVEADYKLKVTLDTTSLSPTWAVMRPCL